MTQRPDEHALAVQEGQISPVIVYVTIVIAVLFLIAFVYRLGITVL